VGTSFLSPGGKSSVSEQVMVNRFQVVSANSEEFLNLTVDTEKLLSLSY